MQRFRSAKSNFGKKKYSGYNSFSKGSNSGGRNRSGGGRRTVETLDISQFIQRSKSVKAQEPVEIKNNFADFSFSEDLKKNLIQKKYTTPTPIQDQSIKYIMEGRDLIGLANTGTGKTGAFLLPLIEKMFKDKSQRTIIIAPTRELALQIENEFRSFSYGMKIFYTSCVGGLSIYTQINNLRRNPHVVIGTPGRLMDLAKRGHIKFPEFKNIVLDEVDRMLDMGFIKDITEILSQLPKERQSLFFSATMPPKIRELVQKFLKDPITVEAKSGETAANVEQEIVHIPHKDMKFDKLQELLNKPELSKVLIFSETKHGVEKLAMSLIRQGFKAESIHGDKRQGQRQRALKMFKDNMVKILVATDVAARGLDIKNVSHVINYTVPQTYDDYVHRIGRTGRGEDKGKALTFVEAR